MNKKFLSVALFGALLAVSSGTFTSCKDYDDDINSLNDRVDAVEKSLSELKTQFGSLAYVKAVSITNGKLVVTVQSNGLKGQVHLTAKAPKFGFGAQHTL